MSADPVINVTRSPLPEHETSGGREQQNNPNQTTAGRDTDTQENGSQADDQFTPSFQKVLSKTPLACKSLRRLNEGSGSNYVYHGYLEKQYHHDELGSDAPVNEVIVKHAEGHIASMPGSSVPAERNAAEATALKLLAKFPPLATGTMSPATPIYTVRTPRLFFHHPDSHSHVQERLTPSSLSVIATDNSNDETACITLKAYALEHWGHVTPVSVGALGNALGKWLRRFHDWADEHAGETQGALREIAGKNESMRKVRWEYGLGALEKARERQGESLNEREHVFKEVQEKTAAWLEEKPEKGNGVGVIHGDFWTGNVLIPSHPPKRHTPDTTLELFVVDWEVLQIGRRTQDLAQMLAELYELKLFKGIDAGSWAMDGFIAGYGGPWANDMGCEVAMLVGVHLVTWGATAPGWGDEEAVEKVVRLGGEIVDKAWKGDWEYFVGGDLACLFKRKMG